MTKRQTGTTRYLGGQGQTGAPQASMPAAKPKTPAKPVRHRDGKGKFIKHP